MSVLRVEHPPQVIMNAESWPPDYIRVLAWRQQQILRLRAKPDLIHAAKEYYSRPEHCVDYIVHWGTTFDPRNAGTGLPTMMPFVLFKKQAELVEMIVHECLKKQENGLVEKARDMGVTWVCVGTGDWLWRFMTGTSIGWGSRKQELVDKIGDPDSIFEKHRIVLRYTPSFFMPKGFKFDEHVNFMRIVNPENGSTITGEVGDDIGRGGRKTIYFKDESSHYKRPEQIEAALSENTRVQIDVSSVNGPGNVFHRRREAGVDWSPGADIPKSKTRVFVFDWRDHPGKTQDWYDLKKEKAESEGLSHIFAQEVDRNYYAAVEGIIIPSEWVKASIDAHLKLKIEITGPWSAALDVADEGGDTNALSLGQGILLSHLEEWGHRDTGKSARHTVGVCESKCPITIQYDAVGVGAGIKAETNRLRETMQLPRKMLFVPWSGGSSPLHPDQRVIPGDKNSPLNKDFYANLKAQGWWELRRRFERTYRAITEPDFTYEPDQLISLDSKLPLLWRLVKELSQPTASRTATLKLAVDKKPEGSKSPNLADSVMMKFWSAKGSIPLEISADVLRRASIRTVRVLR